MLTFIKIFQNLFSKLFFTLWILNLIFIDMIYLYKGPQTYYFSLQRKCSFIFSNKIASSWRHSIRCISCWMINLFWKKHFGHNPSISVEFYFGHTRVSLKNNSLQKVGGTSFFFFLFIKNWGGVSAGMCFSKKKRRISVITEIYFF